MATQLSPGKACGLLIQCHLAAPCHLSGWWWGGRGKRSLLTPLAKWFGWDNCGQAPGLPGDARPSVLSRERGGQPWTPFRRDRTSSSVWLIRPGTARANQAVPPSCAAHARGLKKELLTPHPRAICGQYRNNKPKHRQAFSAARGCAVRPGRASACQVPEVFMVGQAASSRPVLKGRPVAGQR